MPDHIHLLAIGISENADSKDCIRFLRRQLNSDLKAQGFELQSQAYDHVLDAKERERGSFETICHYVTENPIRKGLVNDRNSWSYLGAIVPGFPSLDPRDSNHWDRFWKIHASLLGTT